MSNNITKYRKSQNISQGTLAKMAKISRTHLNRIELGVAEPSLQVAARIAKALGQDINLIFFNIL